MPDLAEIRHALLGPDDGSLFIAVFTMVGWVAWASFAISTVAQIPAAFGRTVARLPGLGPQQALAALLLGAIITTTADPARHILRQCHRRRTPLAASAPSGNRRVHRALRCDTAARTGERRQRPSTSSTRFNAAKVCSTWPSKYLGDTGAYPRIAEANYGTVQPDGRSLQRGETRIYPGWQMRIPRDAITDSARPTSSVATAPLGAVQAPTGQAVYQVQQGDWLWYVSDRYLGDPTRYPEIVACNPELLTNPNHIEPGWRLTLPADAYAQGPRVHATGALIDAEPDPEEQPTPTPTPAPLGPPATSGSVGPDTQAGPTGNQPGKTQLPSASGSADASNHHDANTPAAAARSVADGLHLPSGAWVPLGFAAAVSALLAAARLHRRRRARRRWPIRIHGAAFETPLSEGVRAMRRAGAPTASTLTADPDPAPTTLTAFAVSPDGAEVSLHAVAPGGWALRGPGKQSAVRAIIAATLSASPNMFGDDRGQVHTDTATLATLVDPSDQPPTLPQLRVHPDLDEALAACESELVYRRRVLEPFGVESFAALRALDPEEEPLPLVVLIVRSEPCHAGRLHALAEQAAPLRMAVIDLGEHADLPVIAVAASGTVSVGEDQPTHLGHTVARLATLSSADLSEIFDLVREVTFDPDEDDNPLATAVTADDHDDERAAVGSGTDAETQPPRLAAHDIPGLSTQDDQPRPTTDPLRPVSLSVLGPPQLSTEAVPVNTGVRSLAKTILALLAVNRAGLSLEQIVCELMPDDPPESAKASCRSAITSTRTELRERTGLDAKFIQYDRKRYSIDPETIEVDLWQFHAAIETANTAANDEHALLALSRAVELYQGPFCDDATGDWAEPHRLTILGQALDAHARLAELLSDTDPDRAIATLERAARYDPVNEHIYRMIMTMQAQLGRAAAAMTTFRLLEAQLRTIDAEPNRTTRLLAQKLHDGTRR